MLHSGNLYPTSFNLVRISLKLALLLLQTSYHRLFRGIDSTSLTIVQHPQKYIIYDDKNVLDDERAAIKALATSLGVSYSAMLYRLKRLDLVIQKSYLDYIYEADAAHRREGLTFEPLFNRPCILYQNPWGARPSEKGIYVDSYGSEDLSLLST